MKTVWKYPIKMSDWFDVEMPCGAEVVSVGVQNGQPVMWAIVDDSKERVNVRFRLAGTGHPLQDVEEHKAVFRFVGTVQLAGGNLVFHLFQEMVL